MKLETDGGPMQGPTAGIIRVSVLIHGAEIGINLRREGGRKEKSLNDLSIFYGNKNPGGVGPWDRSGLVKPIPTALPGLSLAPRGFLGAVRLHQQGRPPATLGAPG